MQTIEFNEKYLNWDSISKKVTINGKLQRGLIFLDSPMGSNKTGVIKELVNTARSQNLNILSISARTLLAKKISNDLDLTFYLDDIETRRELFKNRNPYKVDDLDNKTTIMNNYSIVINSLKIALTIHNLTFEDFKNHVIILDESIQILFALNSKIISPRLKIVNIFEQILANAHTVVLSDAHFTEDEKYIYGGIRNLAFRRFKHKVDMNNLLISDFDNKEFPKNILLNPNYIDCLINCNDVHFYIKNNTIEHIKNILELKYDTALLKLAEDIKNKHKIYIATDSKKESEVLFVHIKNIAESFNINLNAILINADTSKSLNINELIRNPAKFNEYDVVICSPTISTGISIDDTQYIENDTLDIVDKYFPISKVYGFFLGCSISHKDILQSLARVRHVKNINITFIESVLNSNKLDMFLTSFEQLANCDPYDRINKILTNRIITQENISQPLSYKSFDNKISKPEHNLIYSQIIPSENFDYNYLDGRLPICLTLYLANRLYANTMTKYLSSPNFHFRNFVASVGHKYTIECENDKTIPHYISKFYHESSKSSISTCLVDINKQPLILTNVLQLGDSLKYRKLCYEQYQSFIAYDILNHVANIESGDIVLDYKNKVNYNEPEKVKDFISKLYIRLKLLNQTSDLDNALLRLIAFSNQKILEKAIIHLNWINKIEFMQEFNKLHNLNLLTELDIKSFIYIQTVELMGKHFKKSYWNRTSINSNSEIVNFIHSNIDTIIRLFPTKTIKRGSEMEVIHIILKLGFTFAKQIKFDNKLSFNAKYTDIVQLLATWPLNHIQSNLPILKQYLNREVLIYV